MTASKPSSVGINIAGTAATANPRTVAELGDQIVAVFQHGYDCHIDQETILAAVNAVADAAKVSRAGVEHTAITNSSIEMSA